MNKNTIKMRDRLSKLRQALWLKVKIMEQRVKDMEVAKLLRDPEAGAKADFCQQEIAKLKESIIELERGVYKQRAWASGKRRYS
jgi:hypothetical protein